MKKNFVFLFFLLCLVSVVFAIDECKPMMKPSDIPCVVTSTWEYSPPCNDSIVFVYDVDGNNILNYTFQDLSGSSSLCYFFWNISVLGSYSFLVSNGDSGNILLEEDNMMAFFIVVSALAVLFLILTLIFENFVLGFVSAVFFLIGGFLLITTSIAGVESMYSVGIGIVLIIFAGFIAILSARSGGN